MTRDIDSHRYHYPWHQWTDGQWRIAEPGVDYADSVSFVATGRRWAARRDLVFEHYAVPDGRAFRIGKEASK